MKTIKVTLSKDEFRVFNQYAKTRGMSLSVLMKKVLEEKIEDELDLETIKQYEENVKNDSAVLVGHNEVKKILKL